MLRNRPRRALVVAAVAVASCLTLAGSSPATADDVLAPPLGLDRGQISLSHGNSLPGVRPVAAITHTTVAVGISPLLAAGDVYAPANAAQTKPGAVIMLPGFTGSREPLKWLGRYLAQNGFVAYLTEPSDKYAHPSARADCFHAAYSALANGTVARDLVNTEHVAVWGHSMGGGGALEIAERLPGLKASIAVAPWDERKNFASITVPTFIISARNDTVAPESIMAGPMYASLSPQTRTAYTQLNNADHGVPDAPQQYLAAMTLSWLKVMVDGNTRFRTALCPGPATGPNKPYTKYQVSSPVCSRVGASGHFTR